MRACVRACVCACALLSISSFKSTSDCRYKFHLWSNHIRSTEAVRISLSNVYATMNEHVVFGCLVSQSDGAQRPSPAGRAALQRRAVGVYDRVTRLRQRRHELMVRQRRVINRVRLLTTSYPFKKYHYNTV